MQSILSDPLLLCTRCGSSPKYQPPGSKRRSWCLSCCRADTKARTAQRLSQGLCRDCDCLPLAGLAQCPYHWVANIARQAITRSANRRKQSTGKPCGKREIDALYDGLIASPRCFYTGLSISPGNASLDHTVPKSRADEFPDVDVFSLSNLQWTHPSINQLKGERTGEEFTVFMEELRAALSTPSLTRVSNG